MIKVLIVDDSKVVQELLEHILSSDPDIKIVGIASSGTEAIRLTREKHPDVITLDFHMPDMDGLETTRIIMEKTPTPIVIVSASADIKNFKHSFDLIESGALVLVMRPPGLEHPGFSNARRELLQTIKLMSEVKVIRHFHRKKKVTIETPPDLKQGIEANTDIKLIAIGASTGGPAAIQKILSMLPKEFPLPVLIVQHISPGFVKGFVEWLSISSGIPVHIASDGEIVKAGMVYVAPDGFHMGVKKGPVIVLSTLPPENGLKPSVDYLFRSVAQIIGKDSIGILLTGMGKDGAVELKEMKDNGAITIIQDEASSVIFGMPGEAFRIGAADHVLPIESIPDFLTYISKTKG